MLLSILLVVDFYVLKCVCMLCVLDCDLLNYVISNAYPCIP